MSAVSMTGLRLVLGSTSLYRKQLLERLGIAFTVAASNVDEEPLPGETPLDLVNRLARAKADAVAARQTKALVIGSDQLAVCGREVLGKPGSGERAIAQLKALSGQRVQFHTAVHVVDSSSGANEGHCDITTVYFRELTDNEIRRYVARDKPYDCAGGFKVEALGISLFTRVESSDPTALVGLPLIWLAGALRRHGFQVP
ncbi:MAG TPA: nucleoside triphosphate pyrophosphatase [Steroidobacteraceae bacterium]|nr:nucleoside triphosphate pyrophosphatase [Steroidobacteraceae bacterium]